MPLRARHSSRTIALLAAAMLALLMVGVYALVALRSDDGDGITGTIATREAQLVFAEFGATSDRIYVASADSPDERALVATVEHVSGWGISPAPRMVGSLVAYTVLSPEQRPQRDSPADLWLLDVQTGEQTRLARDADLLAPPLLSPDGSSVVYRSSDSGGRQSLISIDIATRTSHVLIEVDTVFGVFPFAFDSDGALLMSGLSTEGTDLYRIVGSEAQRLLHASDEIARDWQLAPDGRTLSYLEPELRDERVVHRLRVVELPPQGQEQVASVTVSDGGNEQFSPVWTPDGAGITVGREAYPDAAAAAVTLTLSTGGEQSLPAPTQGFDVPLGWSPDGEYLAARSFTGTDSYTPGRESMVLISMSGGRATVGADSGLIFIGWLSDA